MSYAERYPALNTYLQVSDTYLQSFEVLMHYTAVNLPMIFNLDGVNWAAQIALAHPERAAPKILICFALCIDELQATYSAAELEAGGLINIPDLCKKINQAPNSETVAKRRFPTANGFRMLLEECLPYPARDTKPLPEIGYLERCLTGTAEIKEPISFLDMLRAVHCANKKYSASVVELVFNTHELIKLDPAPSTSAFVVNLNEDAKAMPKWAALYATFPATFGIVIPPVEFTLFSEVPLTAKELACVERLFGPLHFHPRIGWEWLPPGARIIINDHDRVRKEKTANSKIICSSLSHNSLEATGYTALAWLNRELLKQPQWMSYVDADLPTLMRGFTSWNSSLIPSLVLREEPGVVAPDSVEGLFALWRKEGILMDEVGTEGIRKSTLICPQIEPEKGTWRATDLNAFLASKGVEIRSELVLTEGMSISDAYAGLIITLLFKTHANYQEFVIKARPDVNLSPQLISQLYATLTDNPYLLHLDTEENPALTPLHEALAPLIARNRLLHAIAYKPNYAAPHWDIAAKAWLTQSTSLPHLDRSGCHAAFKDTTALFGIVGLTHVLAALTSLSDEAFLEELNPSTAATLYIACTPATQNEALTKIHQHIMQGKNFPFAKLILGRYTPDAESQRACLALLSTLNTMQQLQEVVFADFVLLSAPGVAATPETLWLGELLVHAVEEHWAFTLTIPALAYNLDCNIQVLKAKYAMLTNLMHAEQAQREAKTRVLPTQRRIEALVAGARAAHPTETALVPCSLLADLPEDTLYPLTRGGGLQLQRQQQQQIEQQRRVRNEYHELAPSAEMYLSDDVLTYSNIESRLAIICGELSRYEGWVLDPSSSTLSRDGASPLQNLFHTWINAEPLATATHTISALTKEAALVLLRNQKLFCSGLNPQQLPRGFFTQRTTAGRLVLDYHSSKGYAQKSTPLTTVVKAPKKYSQRWVGDFRQLDMEYYLLHPDALLDERAARLIALFVQLKGETDGCEEGFNNLCLSNPAYAALFRAKHTLISTHWPLFKEVWQCFGDVGLNYFIRCAEEGSLTTLFTPSSDALAFLLPTTLSEPHSLLAWYQAHEYLVHNPAFMHALGQIYPAYQKEGVALFLSLLRRVEQRLGNDFLRAFYYAALQINEYKCSDFSALLTTDAIEALEEMMTVLAATDKAEHSILWLKIVQRQIHHSDALSLEQLWRGFYYFINTVEGMKLRLAADVFDYLLPSCHPININVCLERILGCLIALPTKQARNAFLANLPALDMSNSGVPYALHYEGFKYVADSLLLRNFALTHSGYTVPLAALYSLPIEQHATLFERMIASYKGFNEDDTKSLCALLLGHEAEKNAEHLLLWVLLATQTPDEARLAVSLLPLLSNTTLQAISLHLHQAATQYQLSSTTLNIKAIVAFFKKYPIEGHCLSSSYQFTVRFKAQPPFVQAGTKTFFIHEVLKANPSLLIFEVLDYLDSHSGAFIPYFIPDLLYRIKTSNDLSFNQTPIRYGSEGNAIRLTALYGLHNTSDFAALFNKLHESYTSSVPGLIRHIAYLLSLDVNASVRAGAPLGTHDFSEELINIFGSFGIDVYNRHWYATHTETNAAMNNHWQSVQKKLNDLGLVFTYAQNGQYRLLVAGDIPNLDEFCDHKEGIRTFLLDHVVLPVAAEQEGLDFLRPLLSWLKSLQMSITYLDELTALLRVLGKTPKRHYWSASYLSQLLNTLQPESASASFPLSVLTALLQEEAVAAKPLDGVQRGLDTEVEKTLQRLINDPKLDSISKTLTARLLTREQLWEGDITRFLHFFKRMEVSRHDQCLSHSLLNVLLASKDSAALTVRHKLSEWLLKSERMPFAMQQSAWDDTLFLWLNALVNETGLLFLQQIKPAEHSGILLYVLAWSTLTEKQADVDPTWLSSKHTKLITRLQELSREELMSLAACYPQKPAPNSDEVLRILKERKKGVLFAKALERVMKQPITIPRPDYGCIALTRIDDVQRILASATFRLGTDARSLTNEQLHTMTNALIHLKSLEKGSLLIAGTATAVAALTQPELAALFKDLAGRASTDLLAHISLCAILFEAIGRTTGKYPHLAQQCAFIIQELYLKEAASTMLQLATGEGKSHFIAMRAARMAAMGLYVDVCTAKRSLAERDAAEYQDFYAYLGLKVTFIHPHSSKEQYNTHQIHYMTLPDYSLFRDRLIIEEGVLAGYTPNQCYGLIDEGDIHFSEEATNQYNYAKVGHHLPKAMLWFYEAINQFYLRHKSVFTSALGYKKADLQALYTMLHGLAERDEERIQILKSLSLHHLKLLQWLQAAHQADCLKRDVDYCLVERAVAIDGEPYIMQEVIPLSPYGQKMEGSTFSEGVHQLLAARLNSESQSKGELANIHLHAESAIISSQVPSVVIKRLWARWEGFTGTISPLQTAMLHADYHTVVLHCPTNQATLRHWHPACFLPDEAARMQALLTHIKTCLGKKESLLICCAHDKEVLQVMTYLKQQHTHGYLSDAELAALLPYTNESELTPAELLHRKRSLEAWSGGDKGQGVALIAACFSRGDNVHVDAVVLLSGGSLNEVVQKGGRTARNGAPGAVYPLYVASALREEERKAITTLRAHHVDSKAFYRTCFAIDLADDALEVPETTSEACYERLLRLREYLPWYREKANLGYQFVRAHFTFWGSQLIGSAKEAPVEARANLFNAYQAWLQHIEDFWTKLGAREENPLRRIKALEHHVTSIVGHLSHQYTEWLHRAPPPYTATAYQEPVLVLRATESSAEPPDALTMQHCIQRLSLEYSRSDLHPIVPAEAHAEFVHGLSLCDDPTVFSGLSHGLSLFYNRYIYPKGSSREERQHCLALLLRGLAPQPMLRTRLLSTLELWMTTQPERCDLAFLNAVCKLMAASTSSDDWQRIQRLAVMTQAWWLKDSRELRTIPYALRVQQLWVRLADGPIDNLVLGAFDNRGKAWFEVAHCYLDIVPTLRTNYPKELLELTAQIKSYSSKEKKSLFLAQLAQAIRLLNELATEGHQLRALTIKDWSFNQYCQQIFAATATMPAHTTRHTLRTNAVLLLDKLCHLEPVQRPIMHGLIESIFTTMDAPLTLFDLRVQKALTLLNRMESELLTRLLRNSRWSSIKEHILAPELDVLAMNDKLTRLLAELNPPATVVIVPRPPTAPISTITVLSSPTELGVPAAAVVATAWGVSRNAIVLTPGQSSAVTGFSVLSAWGAPASAPAPASIPAGAGAGSTVVTALAADRANELLEDTVNLSAYPRGSSTPLPALEQIAIGDLHANPIKLLYSLLRHGVVSLSNEDYEEVISLYQTVARTEMLSAEQLHRYKELIGHITLIPGALGRICLIGDETCDRGENDLFILQLLHRMREIGVNYNILWSNHGHSFVSCYELNKEFGSDFLNEEHSKSSRGLQKSINEGLVSRAEVQHMIATVYKPFLHILSYVISEDGHGITVFSHAGIGRQSLKGLCIQFSVEYKDETALELAATIDQINAAITIKREACQLHILCPTEVGRKAYSGEPLCPELEAVPFVLWNRFFDSPFMDRSLAPKGYPVHWVHGHHKEASKDNVYSLDSDLAKAATHLVDKYNVLLSQGYTSLSAYLTAHPAPRTATQGAGGALSAHGLFSPPPTSATTTAGVPAVMP